MPCCPFDFQDFFDATVFLPWRDLLEVWVDVLWDFDVDLELVLFECVDFFAVLLWVVAEANGVIASAATSASPS